MNDRLIEKAKETKRQIHSLRSLRTAYTLLVLLILVSAGIITASVYIILYLLDFIPSAALTPLILPVIVRLPAAVPTCQSPVCALGVPRG